jgi:hypothetical protein
MRDLRPRRSLLACALTVSAWINLACNPGSGPPAASGGSAGSDNAGSGGSNPVPSGGGPGTGGAPPSSGGASGGQSGGANPGTGGATGGAGIVDVVTLTTSTYAFQHYPIEVDAGGVWNGPVTPGSVPTTTTFDTVILENGYLKVTLLPDYGGRILSIVHKPTTTELLYQNPMGVPYLMNEEIFYYDYLVILGGIFPSFPEPEHGRHWNQPYEFQIVSEAPDAITVRMSRQDSLEQPAGVPSRYEVGTTGLMVDLDVTLRAGRSSLELETKLSNPGAAIPQFEYWTVTTLAPGSVPGDTKIPEATRILADMNQVHLLESSWAWFADAETRIDGEIFEWNNLSSFENWVDQGTAFANPNYPANWSGLINYDNDRGILHVSEGPATPGLKLWTFGTQSLTVDLNDSTEWLRPTIEMWHGVTPEFWSRDSMAAGEVRSWTDTFFPTLDLREVTAASEYGALSLSSDSAGTETVLTALATLTVPDQTVHAVLWLAGTLVLEQDVVVAPGQPTKLEVTVPNTVAVPGAAFSVEFLQGQTSLLAGQMTLP